MQFDAVITVEKEFGREDFLRALLIKLGTQKDTPADVVNADFHEVEESVVEVIACTADVEGHCTASVGFDRQEAYIDYETYKEKVGDTYVTRQRPVTRYKTVTDWQVFQTSYAGEGFGFCRNEDEFSFRDDDIAVAIGTVKEGSLRAEGTAEVNATALHRAQKRSEREVEHSAFSFPGDHVKNIDFRSQSQIKFLSCYKLPYYTVTYTYKGKDYTATCFGCGTVNIDAETPPNDVDITAIAKENTKEEEKTQKTSWMWFTLSLIGAAVLCIFLKFPWLFPIPIVLLLKAKKDSDTYSKRYQGYSDYYSKNVTEAKVEALTQALETRGFEPMDSQLRNAIEAEPVPGAKPLESKQGRVGWSWFLSILLAVISFITAYSGIQKNLHSPKQVQIQVVSKQVYYDESGYYIELDYRVKTKRLGVERIDLIAHVSDKQGKILGTINTTLTDLGLNKKDSTVITITLKERRPENNPFFVKLYEADLDDLKFEIEYKTINFSDNKNYYD